MRSVLDADCVESDAFWLFESVMAELKPLFRVQTREERRAMLERLKQEKKVGGIRGAAARATGALGGCGGLSSSARNGSECPSEDPSLSPLLALCARVQHRWLRQADPECHARLATLGIEPQLYAMKWARLMFGREFHIDDVSLLWDALFAMRAAGREPSLAADGWTNAPLPQSIELVAVAMVVREREFLMSRDYSQALKRLMKYPPVENVLSFAARARAMRRMMSEGCPLSEAFRRATDDPKDRHDGEHAIERHESPSGGQQAPIGTRSAPQPANRTRRRRAPAV